MECATMFCSEWFLTLQTKAVPSYSRIQQPEIPRDEGTTFLQSFLTTHQMTDCNIRIFDKHNAANHFEWAGYSDGYKTCH
jgi:hypothetical protein